MTGDLFLAERPPPQARDVAPAVFTELAIARLGTAVENRQATP